MRIFLLWRSIGDKGAALAAEDVTAKLQKVFAPLFGTPIMQTVHQNPGMALVLLELPVQRWKPPFVQEDEHTCALAVDYPINGRTVLAANGVSFSEDNFLPALCHRLQTEPRTLLKDLAPPFSLVWTSKQTGETYIQNDGLGQSQLFEFQDEHLWALSNKITAFKALGVSLVPEPEQWAVWATVGWFPLEMSGYKNIRFLAPATRLRLTAEGLSRTSHDVLSDWVHPLKMTPTDCLELARCSLLNLIEGCESLWMKPSAGLSGGWDSRAVVASLRKVSVDFSARVRGLPGSHDVVIATELARIAGMRLKVQAGGLPPEAANSCRRSIELALLWQSGHLNGYRHKTFLAHQPCLEPRPVSVTGQHGKLAGASGCSAMSISRKRSVTPNFRISSTRIASSAHSLKICHLSRDLGCRNGLAQRSVRRCARLIAMTWRDWRASISLLFMSSRDAKARRFMRISRGC